MDLEVPLTLKYWFLCSSHEEAALAGKPTHPPLPQSLWHNMLAEEC